MTLLEMGVTPATAGDAAMRRVIEWREKHAAAAFARDVIDDPGRLARNSRWELESRAASNYDKDWRQPDGCHTLHRFAVISPKEAREAVSEEQLAGMRRLIHQSAYDMWVADDMLKSMLKDALSHPATQHKQCRDNLKPCSKRRSKNPSQSSKKGSSNVSCSSSSISSSPTTTYGRSKDTCCSGSDMSCSSKGSLDTSDRCRRRSGKAMMSWLSMACLSKYSAK